MSWPDVVGGVSTVDAGIAESLRFGVEISRLTVGESWRSQFSSEAQLYLHVTQALRESVVRVVIIRAPSDLVRMSNSIQASRRVVIPAGTLLYWELPLAGRKSAASRGELTLRTLSPRSADSAVRTVINDSFDGYVNHYSYNHLLDSNLVAAGYREWAERSMSSPDAIGLVLEDGGVPVGIATARNWPDEDVLEIELAGIVSGRQGEGLYRELIDGVTREGLALGVSRLAISTQSQNLSVQRAWARIGFLPVASLDTFHAVKSN